MNVRIEYDYVVKAANGEPVRVTSFKFAEPIVIHTNEELVVRMTYGADGVITTTVTCGGLD